MRALRERGAVLAVLWLLPVGGPVASAQEPQPEPAVEGSEPAAQPEPAEVVEPAIEPQPEPVVEGSEPAAQPEPAIEPQPEPAVAGADPEVLRKNLLALWSSDVGERRAAIAALGETRDQRVVPVLGEFLRDRDPPLRMAAIVALGKVAGPASEDLLWKMLFWRASLPEERKAVLHALAEHGTDRAADLLDDLGRQLPGEYGELARTIAAERFPERLAWRRALESGDRSVLAEQPADAELVELLARLSEWRVPAGRAGAAEALARLEDLRAVPALATAARSGPVKVRLAAIGALGKLASVESAHALAELVRPPSPVGQAEQEAAVRALVAHDSPAAAALLFELSFVSGEEIERWGLSGEVDALLGRRLAERMKSRASPTTSPAAEVELLLDIRQRSSTARLRAAVERAGALQAGVLPALVPLLDDQSVSSSALEALGRYQGTEGVRILAAFSVRSSGSMELRERAIRIVASHTELDVAPLMLEMFRRMEDENLRRVLAREMVLRYPDVASQHGLDRLERDRRGLVPMMLVGAAHGAANMWLLSEVSAPGEDKIMVLPALGGAILGAGTPLLLTLGKEIKPSESLWVGTLGLWGITEGLFLAAAMDRHK
ncbi:MAG: hypothetical protein FJ109_18840, partial [Deltaproteobacteria bacterium]|nr:hypothetical protein [Deltaproteobacteria bacterium]